MTRFLLLMFVGAAAPVPEAAAPQFYFPVQKGSRWVYESRYSATKEPMEVVEVVTEVEDGKDGAKVVTVGRVYESGKVYATRKYEVSGRGLFWTADLFGRGLSRPWCELNLPHKKGQTWAERDDGGLDHQLTAQGPEKVKVPAGEYDCIRVEYRDERSHLPNQTLWFTPGIGLVKDVDSRGNPEYVLKSFTPGKK